MLSNKNNYFQLFYIKIAVLSLSVFVSENIFAQIHDFSIQHEIKFIVTQIDSNKYSLISNTNVKQTFLSDRSTNFNRYHAVEHYFDPISEFKYYFREDWFDEDEIFFTIPEREDVFIYNNKIRYFLLPRNIKQGEILKYSYNKNYLEPAYFPAIQIPNSDFFEDFNILIEHPREIEVNFDIYFSRDDISYSIENNNPRLAQIRFKNLEYQKNLEYFPFNDFNAMVFISLKKKDGELNCNTTESFVKWYASKVNLKPLLVLKSKPILSKKIQSAKTDLEKLNIIYNFVQKNFRYVAEEQDINAFIPREPVAVLERMYGDCKERAALITAIARGYGIEVFMALVPKKETLDIDPVSLSKFDHVICAYENNNKFLFFDPTTKYCEFGNLPESIIEKKALILNPDKPKTITISPPNQSISIEVDISVSLDSLKKGKAIIKLRNDYFSAALHAKNDLAGVQLENFLSKIIASNFYKIGLDYFSYIKEDSNSVSFSANADLSHFIISSATKKYIPATPFIFYNNDILKRKNDNQEIYLSDRSRTSLRINIDSQNFIVKHDSFSIGNENTPTYFNADVIQDKRGCINLSYKIFQRWKKIENDQKSAFFEFYNRYLINKKKMFTLYGEDNEAINSD